MKLTKFLQESCFLSTFGSLVSDFIRFYSQNSMVIHRNIQSLLNSAKCNCTMSSIFKNKLSLYRIYFFCGLHGKKFCQHGSLSFYALTLCDDKNFRRRKNKKFVYAMLIPLKKLSHRADPIPM